MISPPILSFNYLLIAILGVFIAVRLFGSFRRKPSQELYSFFLFYVFFSTAFFVWSLPYLITYAARYIALLYAVGYLLFYLSLAYLLYLAFSFFGKEGAAYASFYFIVMFGVLSLLINYSSNIVFFESQQYTSLLRFATGLVASSSIGISALVFFVKGMQAKGNFIVFMRSLWLSGGIFFVFLAVILGFIINTALVTAISFAATIFMILGFLAIVRGVLYKKVG